ncbi:MAG: NAD-dependent epimerase/dehydratase family protein [Fidelibacterota bacterium]
MRILITGGSGFIGRNLKEYFSEKHEIHAPNHNELDLLNSDQVNSFLAESKFDIVIHCATWDATRFSKKDPLLIFDNNLKMYFNLAYNHHHYGHMFYFGSGAEFTRKHWKPLMSESYFGVHIPDDPYGLSKYVMNLHCNISHNIYNLRLFGVFGKYEDYWVRFISNIIFQSLQRNAIVVNQERRFDYLYIRDLCRIVEHYITCPPPRHSTNICTSNPELLQTLANRILSILDIECSVIIRDPGELPEYSGDNSKLMKDIPDLVFTPLEESIPEVYEWMKSVADS